MRKKLFLFALIAALTLFLSACQSCSNNQLRLRGHIVDVVRGEIIDGEILIRDGRIASISPCEVEATAPFYMPGWVDSHVHIESSMMLPEEFAHTARRWGTIAAIADPHEIGNVLGVRGVELMLDNAKGVPFYFGFGAPSCVPACGGDIETSGAVIDSRDVAALLARDDIYALAEMMNFPGVLNADAEVMAKIAAAKAQGKPVDGHAPGLLGEQRLQYAAAGISTDHECSTLEEARSAVEAGMYVQIREGSAAKNYDALHPILAEAPQLAMFATDDSHPTDFLNGHIDRHVRRSLSLGYPLMDILRAASLNPIRHYHLPCGLLQVGDVADLIAISDTTPEFKVLATYIAGVNHRDTPVEKQFQPESWMNTCSAAPLTEDDIAQVPAVLCEHQIVAHDRSLLTEHYVGAVDQQSNKIVTYNRFTPGAKPSVGYIRGFQMERGAFAQSIAHDCHNILAVGADDASIVRAINRVIEMGGGVVVTDGETIQELALPVAGLISPLNTEQLAQQNRALEDLVHRCGCEMGSPFITLGFMALPVIPALKLTDKGMFDVATWSLLK